MDDLRKEGGLFADSLGTQYIIKVTIVSRLKSILRIPTRYASLSAPRKRMDVISIMKKRKWEYAEKPRAFDSLNSSRMLRVRNAKNVATHMRRISQHITT